MSVFTLCEKEAGIRNMEAVAAEQPLRTSASFFTVTKCFALTTLRLRC